MIVTILGVTRDGGPIHLTIDMGEDQMSDTVAIFFAKGVLSEIGYQAEELYSVLIDGRPVWDGAATKLEDLADEMDLDKDYLSGTIRQGRLDGMGGIRWQPSDDEDWNDNT